MREVICHTAKCEGEKILVEGIYVRSTVPMPEVGEEAVVINPETCDEFLARVIAVNPKERKYNLRVDLRRPA